MKTTGFLALAGLAAVGSAHFTWDKIAVGGKQVGGDNQYIRKHDNYYLPIKFNKTPEGSITPNDAGFACNKNARPAPDVLKVKANDMVSLNLGFGAKRMEHPGSVQVYVSPVANAKADSGKDWYKIHQALICKQGNAESLRSTAWCMWGEGGISAPIPETLPNGQYLMRAEQISLHGAHDGQAEFYVACAQIEVTGNSATSIQGTAVQFPGAYKSTDKAVNFSVWGRSTSFDVIPGPDVIPGGTIRGSANGAGGDKTVKVAANGAGGGNAAAPSTPAPSTPANNSGNNNNGGSNNNNSGKNNSGNGNGDKNQQPGKSTSPGPDCNKKRSLRARRAAMAAAQQ
ncbi:fungal cellulose binding domain-containing protein [Gaeumannomyces tritici R3-111a-1]|uniref:lytic cellulose monooxygenase (C4-dehydrogenating) n=1 Tax=Gaeumannomyces tritici (strain R3-111a-1) TaxID=644352 RepID=J3PGQ0_GAET3|nr:fungal cellulose binding domain-containing protein [Gaeumannomyces tritici R3-111a-1]EJT69796.1 fungal cellulose binding domain-containing protein [Gaeumannomyces tritici R3-111a-1]